MVNRQIGIARCAAYVLGGPLRFPDDRVSRVALRNLIPHRVWQGSADGSNVLRRWLRTSEQQGLLERGTSVIHAVDREGLMEEATWALPSYTTSDFLGIERARHRLRELLRQGVNPPGLAGRLEIELDALRNW